MTHGMSPEVACKCTMRCLRPVHHLGIPPRCRTASLAAVSTTTPAVAAMPVRTVTLSDGKLMPTIAFGSGTTWFRRREDINSPAYPIQDDVVAAVRKALDAGFTHLDAAEMYGTEREMGLAVSAYCAERGVSRDQLFITTKVYDSMADVKKVKGSLRGTSKVYDTITDVEKALRDSLHRLKLTYVDLFLVHAPFQPDFDITKTWPAMEALVEQGLTRSIGVSNFRVDDLVKLMAIARIKPVVNQFEAHPYLQQDKMDQYCKANGILQEAYSPLLTLTRQAGGPVDAVVDRIAQEVGATPGQVLLAWSLARGFVPITTSSNTERLQEFVAVATEGSAVNLTQEQVTAISDAGASRPPHRQFWPKDYGDLIE